MSLRRFFGFCVIIFCFLICAGVLFAQEEAVTANQEAPAMAQEVKMPDAPVTPVDLGQEQPADSVQSAPVEAPQEVPVQAPQVVPAEAVQEVAAQQAEPAVPEESVTKDVTQEAQPTSINSTEWVWGEVVSVDTINKQLVLKHLDYDTYEEVQTTLKMDNKTLLENVSELGDIQSGDHVTVDYVIQNGDNVAGLVVVEKKDTQKEVVEAPKDEPVAAEEPSVSADNMETTGQQATGE